MKKLLILFFILSVGCFGQLVRKPVSSGGGLVGLKDTTDGVVSNGINNFWFGVNRDVSGNTIFPLAINKLGDVTLFSVNSVGERAVFNCSTYFDSASSAEKTIEDFSPVITFNAYWNDINDLVEFTHVFTSDSSYAIHNSATEYGLHIRPSGQLQSVTENGTENVLTDYGTLSGTVYVKDTNNVIKSLTFTNGLLTASDLGDFAGVFESSETNLTQTNFKQSPDYAEFLEFQKYLAMKKQLAKK